MSEAQLERRYRSCMCALLALSLAARLWYVLVAHPTWQFIFSDMQSYDGVALELLAGQANPWHAFRPVGYPMLLALVYRLTDASRTFVGVLQALMSAALVSWAAQIARAVGATRAAAFAVALAVSTSVPLLFYSGLLLTEVPTAFFLLFALRQILCSAAGEAPPARRWLQAGLALGLASAMRPNLLLLVPLPLLYLGCRRGARGAALAAGLFCASLALPLATVSLYNSRALGRVTGPSTNGGLNFYLNFADVRSVQYSGSYGGYWVSPVPNGLRYTRDEIWDVPFFDERHYYRQGLRFVIDHPSCLLRAFDNYREAAGLGAQIYWPNWRGYEKAFRDYAHGFFAVVLLPALAYLGVLLALLRRRTARPEQLLVGAVCIAASVPMYLFLGDPRVRVPFDPLWAVLAALAYQSALGALLRWRRGLPS